MIYACIIISIVFLVLAFSLNENNAPYVLSGYNTLSKEEQAKVDLKPYLLQIKTTHLFLGVTIFPITLLLDRFLGGAVATIFLVAYPILAYIYMAWKSMKTLKGSSLEKNANLGLLVMIGVLGFVLVLFFNGMKDNSMVIKDNVLEFKGMYGEKIEVENISRIQLVDSLPIIKWRNSGLTIGSLKKGKYVTSEGENIKLLINSSEKPFILINRNDSKERLYYSSTASSASELFDDLVAHFPKLTKTH